MKIHVIEGVRIKRIACTVPQQQYALAEYAPNLFDEKSAKRMARGTGFAQLRIAPEQVTTADLCAQSAEHVLAGVDKEQVGAMVFVSQTPDYVLPATSHVLQNRLGLSNDTLCLDINEGCAGWVSGLYAAANCCKNMKTDVCFGGGDTISKLTHPEDRATRSIFGDAGTATLLEPGPGRLVFAFQSFGESKDAIIVRNRAARREHPQAEHDGTLYLDGGAIMEFALDKVPVAINEMLQACGQTVENVSLFACHQANQLILRSLADELGVAREKVPFTAGKIGNE